MKLELELTCHDCPNQYSGTLTLNHPFSGKPVSFPFYFRARHESWSFTLVKSGEDPIFAKNPIYSQCGVGAWSGTDSLPHVAEEITKAQFTIYNTVWKKAVKSANKRHQIWFEKFMKKCKR